MEVLEKRFRPTVKGYVCHKLLLTKWWLVISRLDKKSNSNLICKCRMYIVFRCCKHLILIFHKCESIARIRQNKAAKPYVVHKSQQTMAHPETGSRSCKKTLTFYISLSVIFFEHTLEQNMWNLLVFEKKPFNQKSKLGCCDIPFVFLTPPSLTVRPVRSAGPHPAFRPGNIERRFSCGGFAQFMFCYWKKTKIYKLSGNFCVYQMVYHLNAIQGWSQNIWNTGKWSVHK